MFRHKFIYKTWSPCKNPLYFFIVHWNDSSPQTLTETQATQQDSLPSLLGDGDKWTEIVFGEEKIFCTGPTRAAKAVKNLLYQQDEPNKPTKDPFHMYSLSPHLSQFQQSAGATSL
jgi:hypothetical protein